MEREAPWALGQPPGLGKRKHPDHKRESAPGLRHHPAAAGRAKRPQAGLLPSWRCSFHICEMTLEDRKCRHSKRVGTTHAQAGADTTLQSQHPCPQDPCPPVQGSGRLHQLTPTAIPGGPGVCHCFRFCLCPHLIIPIMPLSKVEVSRVQGAQSRSLLCTCQHGLGKAGDS